ncbi:MAG: hypothetical protein N3A02_03455 [Rectinema sp.]|nr:hypothetical protein [Rectinema sp.]
MNDLDGKDIVRKKAYLLLAYGFFLAIENGNEQHIKDYAHDAVRILHASDAELSDFASQIPVSFGEELRSLRYTADEMRALLLEVAEEILTACSAAIVINLGIKENGAHHHEPLEAVCSDARRRLSEMLSLYD